MEDKARRRSVGRLDSLWKVLRGVWAAEARYEEGSAGVSLEQIWEQTLRLDEEPIDFRVVNHNLRVLEGHGLVVGEVRARKVRYRSTNGEREAVEAELGTVFDYLLHGDPELIGLAHRLLGEQKPSEAES